MQLPDKPVPWMKLFLKMGGWFPIGLAVLTVILSAVAWQFEARAERFEREGVMAPATILSKEVREGRDSDGDTTYTYLLNLAYQVDGRQLSQLKSTGRRDYRARAEGDVFDIRYLETMPGRIEYPVGSTGTGATAIRWAVLVPGLIALGLLYIIGGWATKAVMTRWNGDRRLATKTGLKQTNVKVNGAPRYRLTWREPDDQVGQSLMHPKEHLDAIPTKLVIYRNGKDAWWEGDIGPRKGLKPGPNTLD
ncbi:MAG: hypothetical protein ACU0DW_11685 [Shimia sp.]